MSNVINLEFLKSQGAISDGKAVEKEVKWKNNEGEELVGTIFVRKRNFKEQMKILDPSQSSDFSDRAARIICYSISTDASGSEDLLTYDQACFLETSIADAFLTAINEVNETKKA